MCEREIKMENTSPEIMEQSTKTPDNFLPEKSKERYEIAYQKFMDWRTKNKIDSFSENVLMTYFGHISNQFKPSSLWSTYSMLRSVLNIKQNVNIAAYPKLRAYLKKQSAGFSSKKSNTLTPDQIKKIIKESPNSKYLFMKTALIFGITGACRKQELKNLNIDDVEDSGKLLHVKISNNTTKIPRSFVVSGNFYEICKQYINVRQKVNANIKQFFVNYQRGKCTKQVVGINKFGKIPSQIAEYLELENPSSYTGHCFRRTSATIHVDASGDLIALKKHGGWKSSTSTITENYVDDSIENRTSTEVKTESVGAESNNEEAESDNEHSFDTSTFQVPSTARTISFSEIEDTVHNNSINNSILTMTSTTPIMIQNCHNFTINYIQEK